MNGVSKTALLVCGTVAFVACVGAYVALSWLRVDTAPFLVFVGGAAVTLLPGLAAWRNTETIKAQTNGPLEAMRADIERLHERMDKAGVAS